MKLFLSIDKADSSGGRLSSGAKTEPKDFKGKIQLFEWSFKVSVWLFRLTII